MTISTDGQICFGVLLEEETELPWDENGIEEWWLKELGYNPPFEMFTPAGDWIGGKEWPEDRIKEYFDHRYQFVKENRSLPVEEVNVCSDDYPILVLAIPTSCFIASRGYPQKINPENLKVTNEEVSTLIQFCQKYKIEYKSEPAWYLSSYWG